MSGLGSPRPIVRGAGALGIWFVAPPVFFAPAAADPSTTLLFSQPAWMFHQSLPFGNGRIGAMVFGGVAEERIILNEGSVWSGSRENNDRADAHKSLPEIRRLLAEGKNPEAAELVMKNFTCQGAGSRHGNGANAPFGCNQTLRDLRLGFAPVESSRYSRTLDRKQGVEDR